MAMKRASYDYIICGGGASGLLLALQMEADVYFKNKRVLLVEQQQQRSNDRTWCFWEKTPGFLEEIVFHQWDHAFFNSPNWESHFPMAPYRYKMIRGIDFYTYAYKKIEVCAGINLLTAQVTAITEEKNGAVITTSKGHFEAPYVFSSINTPERYLEQKKYPVLQQHFLGWTITTPTPTFNADEIVFMDFDIPQKNTTQFMYVLPFSPNKALVEYTLFSPQLLEKSTYEKALKEYLNQKEIRQYTIEESEFGCIPMTAYNFDQHNSAHLLHIGTAGGWTKASTGYTFQKTITKTQALVTFLKQQRPLNEFKARDKYNFYDLLFLDVLSQHNGAGAQLFRTLFQNNTPETIFRFLDEQSSLWDELKIMWSFPKRIFVAALLKRLF